LQQFKNQLRSKKRGFILIEVLIAISIMVTLLYLSLSALRFHEYSVCQEIQKLRYFILCMQHQSRLGNEMKSITFCPSDTACCYTTEDKKTYFFHNEVFFGFQRGLLGPPSRPTKPIEQAITFSHNTVCSYEDGMLDAGTIYMTNKDKSITYALTTAVGSESLCRIYKFDAGSWHLLQ
jgi:type II secretory pathway pseudopilin PulG